MPGSALTPSMSSSAPISMVASTHTAPSSDQRTTGASAPSGVRAAVRDEPTTTYVAA